jgi:filamentous hemagglutinin
MNGGGFSVLIGNKSTKTTYTDNEVSYSGSLVGSTNGAVTLTAGNNVHITGSDVLSQTATTIVGKNVTIDAAVGSQDITQTQTIHQGGIHVGLSGGAISAAQGVYSAAQGVSQSHDSRLQALYAMQAAQTLFSPGAANGMGLAQGQTGASAIAGAISDPHLAASGSNGNGGQSGDSSGVNLQIGLTGSTASQKQHTHDDVTYGSSIKSAGGVNIAATGGDLNVIGSTIAGNNVALSAAHDINLLSQTEQHSQSQNSSNASAGVGVSIGTNGFNVYVQASMGKANAHGNGETHTDTSVTASNTLSLLSGNDTTIQGAQATGNTVLADIGHNLNIISEQDTNDYASKQWQAGGTVMFGMGGGGSFSYNQSSMKSNYASVTQMSGIVAGNGGFNIQVGGNTDLKGAVIASSASADKNILDTGSLTYSNIQNQSHYSASSFGVGGGGGASSFSAAPTGLGVPQSGSSSSTTDAAVAQGTVIVRNDPNQDLSGLSRNASLSNANGISNNFDPQKIAENQQLGMLAGQVGMTAAGDIEQATGMKNGSEGAIALHTVVGGAMAALGDGNVLQGAAGAGVSEASIPYLQQYGSLGVLAGTTLIGGAVGGGSGAATALAGTQYNYLSHPQLEALQDKIKACDGDAVCIESAKSDAESQSAKQEKDLISGCKATGVNCSDIYHDAISTAIDYMSDPLAAQLGLQVDQAVTLQDYANNKSVWGLVYGDKVRSNDGLKLIKIQTISATGAAGGGIVAGAGLEGAALLGIGINSLSGAGSGYISGGKQGAIIGLVTGGAFGMLSPVATGTADYLTGGGETITATLARVGSVSAAGTVVAGAGTVSYNLLTDAHWSDDLPYSMTLGAFAPLMSGEAWVTGVGPTVVGGKGAYVFGIGTNAFIITGTAMDPNSSNGFYPQPSSTEPNKK